jgi:DNA-binding NarL/FixJ family response regulator
VAREAFEEALRLGDGVADALEQALALASYGRFLRRRGERRAAQERLQASRERFVSMGATPFVERCDEELAAAGLTPEPSERSPTEGLTPQEQIVARLACRGLTNNEMAHQLVLSVKTVGYHLTNVYTKLDVHSRAQLVAKMSRG